MREYLKKLRTTAERWRDRFFEALGFVPSAELYASREAYNDELRERLRQRVRPAYGGAAVHAGDNRR